jgi:hypothetical protein
MPHRLDKGAGLVDRLVVQRSLKVGLDGTDLMQLKRYTPSLSPAQVAANTTAEQTFTVNGVAVGDVVVSVNKPTAQAGLGIVGWRVAGNNQVALVFSNNTGSGITPTPAEVYVLVVVRF